MESYVERLSYWQKEFADLSNRERYLRLIEMGRALPSLREKREEMLVYGCQGKLYLQVDCQEGKLSIAAEADALISAGLAALAIALCDRLPPSFVADVCLDKPLKIAGDLSQQRIVGFASLLLRLKLEATAHIPKERACAHRSGENGDELPFDQRLSRH